MAPEFVVENTDDLADARLALIRSFRDAQFNAAGDAKLNFAGGYDARFEIEVFNDESGPLVKIRDEFCTLTAAQAVAIGAYVEALEAAGAAGR